MAEAIYLVKKYPDQTGEQIEWLQMNSKEFMNFRRSPEGKGRFFIELTDDIDFECPNILIEVSRTEYLKWKKGYERHRYVRNNSKEVQILSLDWPLPDGAYIGENLPSSDESIEDMIIKQIQQERVRQALQQLSEAERYVIHIMFYGNKPLTEEEAANALGMSKSALHRWKKKIFRKIEKIMRTKT